MRMRSVVAALAAACSLVAQAVQAAPNPLFGPLFTADPAALVDGGRVYLYVGRDEAPPGGKDYVMHEWRVYSSCDMVSWRDHGVPLKAADFAWATQGQRSRAWASHVVKHPGNGRYYFFSTVEHATVPGFAVGVAVADRPEGPFVDAIGRALITNDMTKQTDIAWDDIDPAVFIDAKTGQAHLYWGNTVLKHARLKPSLTELDGPINVIPVKRFTEAAYVHERQGVYYLSYASGWPEEIAYLTAPSPEGPWTPRGRIMEKNEGTGTIHQAIFDFNGRSYIAYHNAKLKGGGEHRRSVAVEELQYGAEGAIRPVSQTAAGPRPNPAPTCKAGK